MPFDDSGPAFPVLEKLQEYRDDRYVDLYMPMGGMTLRDYFAGQALAGFVQFWGNSDTVEIAKRAYGAADAMIEVRKK